MKPGVTSRSAASMVVLAVTGSESAHRGNAIAADADVRAKPRVTCPVHYPSVANHEVEGWLSLRKTGRKNGEYQAERPTREQSTHGAL